MEHKDLHSRIDAFFSPQGTLSQYIPGFEARDGQRQMAHQVLDAFIHDKIALIDAGTGIGKSLAYLVAALLWSEETEESIILSTNTISLQEQLFDKDLPLAQRIVKKPLKVVIAKGMRNYVCDRRLHEELQAPRVADGEQKDLALLYEWSRSIKIKDKASLSFLPSYKLWDKVCVDSDTCSPALCQFTDECSFLRTKKLIADADIIITNHSLLLTDSVMREESDELAILPDAAAIIIDEAHHIEDKAIEFFAKGVSFREISKIALQGDPYRSLSKLARCKKVLQSESVEDTKFFDDLDLNGTMRVRTIEKALELFFDTCLKAVNEDIRSQRVGILPHVIGSPQWKEMLVAKEGLYAALAELYALFEGLEKKLSKIKDDTARSMKGEVHLLKTQMGRAQTGLSAFFETKETAIRWIEKDSKGLLSIYASDVDSGSKAKEAFLKRADSLVFCSATLMAKNSFSFVKKSLGIIPEKESLSENHFPSPFSYKSQVLLGCPVDLPLPEEMNYADSAAKALKSLLEISQGNAFILFTSYSALEDMYGRLEKVLDLKQYTFLKHGTDHRSELVKRFKSEKRPILFGTDSFWEGVDVVGDALRLVVIMKLPFQVPSDPVVEAKSRIMKARGEDSFSDFSVPKACVKFKQAFGRLIRHKDDRGSVICLDTRLIKKRYGKDFIQSLPECRTLFCPLEEIASEMRSFYRR